MIFITLFFVKYFLFAFMLRKFLFATKSVIDLYFHTAVSCFHVIYFFSVRGVLEVVAKSHRALSRSNG